MPTPTSPDEQTWHIVQRWQQYEGEARANLLRIAAIGTFYLIHLWNYFSSQRWRGISDLWRSLTDLRLTTPHSLFAVRGLRFTALSLAREELSIENRRQRFDS